MPTLKLVDSRYPPEWETIPSELLERLAPQGEKFITTRQRAALNRIAAGRNFLIRNVWDVRCDKCNRIHTYLTLACVEAPFNGLRQFYEWIDSQDDPNRIYDGLREFSVRNPGLDSIVPISQSDADTYNQRIRDRREVPVIDQRPLRPEEVDELAMSERIVRRARRIRAAAQAMNV